MLEKATIGPALRRYFQIAIPRLQMATFSREYLMKKQFFGRWEKNLQIDNRHFPVLYNFKGKLGILGLLYCESYAPESNGPIVLPAFSFPSGVQELSK